MIGLKRLSIDDGNDIYSMLQEIPAEGNGLINKANGLTFEEFKEWLIGKHADSEQIGIADGWKVPSTTYWLYVDGTPVGFGSVRQFLTDALRIAGNEILKLLLKEARKTGMDKVLLTIHTDNAASIAVALANGGIITDKTDERIYIWIDVEALSIGHSM